MDDQQLVKLNDDKTELIIITTSETTNRQEDIVINTGDWHIAPSMDQPRNLGVLFDSTCCLNDHVNKFCQILAVSCILSVKFESTLTNQRLKKL